MDYTIKYHLRNISKTTKPNWQYELELPPVKGKRRRKSKSGFPTKEKARKSAVSEIEKYQQNPNWDNANKMTYGDMLDKWFNSEIKPKLKETTSTGYEKKLKRIKKELGHITLSKIRTVDINEFITELINENISRNSLVEYKSIMTKSFNYAIDILEIISKNPATRVSLPQLSSEAMLKSNRHPHSYISSAKIDKIIERFPEGTSAHIPLLLCTRLGLRRAEAFGLTWGDIDFKSRTLRVNRQLQYSEKRKLWYLSTPKYNSGRVISIDNKTLAVLKRAKKAQEQNKKEQGDRYLTYYINNLNEINLNNGKEIDFVNVRENGELITSNICQYTSEVIQRKLNIPEFTWHSLRHTHATMLLENGADPKSVQERLGHKTIKETMDIYAHCTKKMNDNVLDIANAIY